MSTRRIRFDVMDMTWDSYIKACRVNVDRLVGSSSSNGFELAVYFSNILINALTSLSVT